MMNVIERPLPKGSNRNDPKLIVVHAMAEYLDMKDGPEFASDFLEKIGLSAHVLVLPNGDIVRCRQDSQGAYHARGFNTDSLGIEFLVPGIHNYGTFVETIKTDWVTADQYASGIDVINSWIDLYDIKNIDRHSDLSPERKVDPGDGFKWDWFNRFLKK